MELRSMTERQRELLDGNRIGNVEVQAIAEALKVNTTLTQLELSDNQIGHAGTKAIAEALKVNTTLTRLSLSGNQIGYAGAQAMALTTLTVLSLGANQLGDSGALAIAEALKANKTLTALDLQLNQIGTSGAQAIAEALKVNTTVTYLGLDGNQIGDAGALAIAEALKVNTMLKGLLLYANQIGDVGAQGIAAALMVNTTLKAFPLAYNCIGHLGSQAIDEARKRNCGCLVEIGDQINPLAFSLLPRLASAGDSHTVFGMLTSGLELENQPASLPALPTEIAELIMDKAHYWQGLEKTKRWNFHVDTPDCVLKVTVPQEDSIRVKVIQVLRERKQPPNNIGDCVLNLTVRDEQGTVQYECAVHPTFVSSNLALATIRQASHPIIQQMREGWEVQLRPSTFALYVLLERLYVGYTCI
ncbi:hypothetical protein CAOG_007399 [Capsaspora owczarzaki ATCC 30864]|uniref:NOD3 protein n=1 Tax=Capsaspora owczarzaki (strain ATCC 30864) TaxID=595528 RepID=A0A0D2W069_CAPO3|nr:hypothetical protein CAOG_007399 [Capsaspora owczarzaki ATCC 30864]